MEAWVKFKHITVISRYMYISSINKQENFIRKRMEVDFRRKVRSLNMEAWVEFKETNKF